MNEQRQWRRNPFRTRKSLFVEQGTILKQFSTLDESRDYGKFRNFAQNSARENEYRPLLWPSAGNPISNRKRSIVCVIHSFTNHTIPENTITFSELVFVRLTSKLKKIRVKGSVLMPFSIRICVGVKEIYSANTSKKCKIAILCPETLRTKGETRFETGKYA